MVCFNATNLLLLLVKIFPKAISKEIVIIVSFMLLLTKIKKVKFANPLHQNLRHIEHFNKMCGFKIPSFIFHYYFFTNLQANYNLQGKQSGQ